MPLYEYQCQSCGQRTEVLQSFSDAPRTVCEACGGELKKLISAPAVQFKGTGWYVTDYAKGGSTTKPGSSEGKEKDGKDKADSGKKESAPAETTAASNSSSPAAASSSGSSGSSGGSSGSSGE